MKIGYVKIAKKKKQRFQDCANNIIVEIKKLLNVVEQDKFKKELFTIYNYNEKSTEKLIKKIKKEGINYVLFEKNIKIKYEKIDSHFSICAMLPELVEKCYELVKPRLDEIHICTNTFCEKNIEIIRELIPRVKIINIVTNNKKYHSLENRLEEQGIYITVTNNKRKSLKNASIVVNLDFKKIDDYNINREMVLIDSTGKICVKKCFNGIIIRRIKTNTNKVLRVFSEFNNFDKSELIEAEIAQINNYNQVRQFIKTNRIYIESIYNSKKIELDEFNRIRKINLEKHNNKNKTPSDSHV